MGENIKIEKPIFIIGTGRCGSTIFYKILANHPDIAYISELNKKFSNIKLIYKLNTIFGKYFLRKGIGFFQPSEAYTLFNSIFPSYSRPTRTLRSNDVSITVLREIKNLVRKCLNYSNKKRFLYKYTGWSRIGFFNEIFPDSLFIHIIRDGRAFVNSILKVSWWLGRNGPQNWRWGLLPERYEKEWKESNQSFSLLAGIQWKMILDEIEISKNEISRDRFIQIKYEDLIHNPIEIFKEITDFCKLGYCKKFEKRLKQYKLKDTIYKWEKELSNPEKLTLNKYLKEHLLKYGYPI